ncbi:phosphate ABC transporter permease PstA [bacterium]|nr:MAG: phosphate ABC transporter permease PstA [bacterium]
MTARRRIADRVFGYLCLGAVLIAAILLVALLWSVFKDGAARLSGDFFKNFTSRLPARAGIKAAVWGSVWVIAVTSLIAVPLGVAAAVWLEEYNSRRNRLVDFIQLNISNLAGVPSIVYGLLGLAVFGRFLGMGRSILAASCTMALLILPMVIIVSQEALKAVPRSYREASFGLGATRWQTIRSQVLPNALPGILTGIILAVSRALGETAPLVVVGAVSYIAAVPKGLNDEFTVLPLQIFDWTSRPQKGFHDAAAAAIIVLLGILLILNGAAIFLRARAKQG